MKDFQAYLLIEFLILINSAMGTVITGKCNLTTGQGINFINQNIRILTDTVYGSKCGYSSYGCCVDSMFDSVDISYFNTLDWWDAFGCCGGDITGIRSMDTIWAIKNEFNIDFSKPLLLSDTSLFRMAGHNDSCHMWIGISYAVKGDIPIIYNWPIAHFIIKTKTKKYLFFRL
jgi:hypothetical protein